MRHVHADTDIPHKVIGERKSATQREFEKFCENSIINGHSIVLVVGSRIKRPH